MAQESRAGGGGGVGRRQRRHPPSVLLLREWEQQMSSSGCCGRIQGDLLVQRGEPVFQQRRTIMEAMGPLYLAIRERFGREVELRVLDPRNLLALIPILIRDFRRYGVGWREALRTLTRISVNSVIVNGRVYATGHWPDPRVFCDELFLLLETEGHDTH